jgi:hypothetical protein
LPAPSPLHLLTSCCVHCCLQIWVLVGGDGAEREASIASGINIASKLQRCDGMRIEPMLVAPESSRCGPAEHAVHAARAASVTRNVPFLPVACSALHASLLLGPPLHAAAAPAALCTKIVIGIFGIASFTTADGRNNAADHCAGFSHNGPPTAMLTARVC